MVRLDHMRLITCIKGGSVHIDYPPPDRIMA
jgi:hypothetical protein